MKSKINFNNIVAYIQGNVRYKLWYSNLYFFISLYIREQIDMRIVSMNKECYDNGSCIKCGCRTTHLQMANKKCEGDCYPKMLSKKQWSYFKIRKLMVIDGVLWKIKHNRFEKIK